MFSNLSLRARLTIVVAVALAGMLLLIVISAFSMRTNLLEGRKALVQSGVQAVVNQIAYYQSLEASGKLSKEEAQARAKEVIKYARYGGADGKTDYYYIWTMDGVGVMHPLKPEFAGQNMLDKLKDGYGNYLIRDMTGALKSQSEAFVPTNFPRPGGKDPVPKLQFVMRFDAWNWMVGTGIYTDDVDAAFRSNLLKELLIALFPLGIVVLVCLLVDKSVLRQLGGEPAYTVDVVQRIAAGQLDTPIKLDGNDKDSLLSRISEMQTQLRELIRQIRESADSIGEMAETVS
ncbi:cache domain-containing protein, partial [Chitinimonas naiadis]